jgi:hypothetical protein
MITHSQTRTLALAFVCLSLSLAACGAPPPEGPSPQPAPAPAQGQGGSVRLVAYEQQPDGTARAVEQVISADEYRMLHDRRLERRRMREAGLEVRQQALTYRGSGNGPYPIQACDDGRTTWLYNRYDGWAVWDGSPMVLGCVGAAVGGSDWEGSLSLASLPLVNGSNWKASLHSFWTSDTDWMTLCPNPGFPFVCYGPVDPWTLANTSPNHWATISF